MTITNQRHNVHHCPPCPLRPPVDKVDGSVWADADDPGRWRPVPAAVPMPGSIRKAVLARLSVWFSAMLRTKPPDQQPPLPPVAVRLCQLPPRRQPPQTHGRPHAPSAHASGSRTYKEKRSRDCVRTSRPQTLAGLSPSDSPRGENNRPGGHSAGATVSAQNPGT